MSKHAGLYPSKPPIKGESRDRVNPHRNQLPLSAEMQKQLVQYEEQLISCTALFGLKKRSSLVKAHVKMLCVETR